MHSPVLSNAVRRIRSLSAPALDGLNDRDLLRRYVQSGDEIAFAALVHRHGPTVLGVCRRVLNNAHDAEDAFQATFLVFARRAAAIQKAASVGCWLHGVAFRTATRLKCRLARQPRSGNVPDVAVGPADDVSWREVRRILDEEVNRLPENQRLAVLLCYFDGKTRDEAAEALGWKLTTLRGRLEDGRLRLRARLAKRGIELSAALLAISAATDGAAVNPTLVESTLRTVGGHAADSIKALAKGFAMSGTLGKATAGVGALLLVMGLGTTAFTFRGHAGDPPAPKFPESPPKQVEEESRDFHLHLRAPRGQLRVDDFPDLVCDLKYTGAEKRSVFNLPENAAIELDGNWYTCHREGSFGGRTQELAPDSKHGAWLTVKPDAQWIHLRDRPDADDPAIKEAIPFRLTAGKHTLRLAYALSKTERAVSNVVTIEVASDGWGEPSGGVRARLRLPKTRYAPGDPLVFDLDLRNVGRKTQTFLPIPFHCEIEVDGRWYIFHGEIDYESLPKELKPGGELVPFVTVKADERWKTPRRANEKPTVREGDPAFDFLPLNLTPGKHTIRVMVPSQDVKAQPASNPVPIEVDSLDPSARALALNADRIWVVSAPTPDRPVPLAEEVLKGPRYPDMTAFDLRLLPGDDPKKKFIAFLKAQEEGKPVRDVKPWPGPVWYLPYTKELADQVRLALLPDRWGEEKSGLRMGLRLRNPVLMLGQPVFAEVAFHNNGKETWHLSQLRFNVYDYWPDTWFEVTAPDGKKWELRKQVGLMKKSDSLTTITLKPGESYVQAVRLDLWPAHTDWRKSSEPVPNLFTKPGEYTITAHYRYSPPLGVGTWTADFASAAEKLVVQEPDDWGDAIGGLKARLRLAKRMFKPGEALVFALDLKNVGNKTIEDYPIGFRCQIDLDSASFNYTAPLSVVTGLTKLEPGKEYRDHVRVTTDEWWRDNRGNRLSLTPGKHRVRISYPVPVPGKGAMRLVSQAVEFAVDPEKK